MDNQKTYRKISELTVWGKNPRSITDESFKHLKKLLRKYGQFKPIIINKANLVIGGNMRLRAMVDIRKRSTQEDKECMDKTPHAFEDVWVSVVNALTDAKKLEYSLADNESVGYWDHQELASLLTENWTELEDRDFKIDTKKMDLDELLESFGPDPDGKEEEPEKEEKGEKVGDEDTRFDKHPRWIKLREEREEAQRKATEAEQRLGQLQSELDNVKNIREAAEFLRKHPEAAKKVEEVLNGFDFKSSEFKSELESIREEQHNLRTEIALKEYDSMVDKFIAENKFEGKAAELVKRMVEKEAISTGMSTLKDLPKVLKSVRDDIDFIKRNTLASAVELKKNESRVPASPIRGKEILAKKESAEVEDVVNELAEGFKNARAEIKE